MTPPLSQSIDPSERLAPVPPLRLGPPLAVLVGERHEWVVLEQKWNGELLNCLEVVLQCARRMTWKRRHPTVKCLEGEYPNGVRVGTKEMKRYEARLQRSTALPKYDITIKPIPTEMQV